ncbi:MAG: hypothetical protein HYT29_02430, partial [Parcubacteria group bacterium]|nr:hypothetical protein [Parcubacteria group bacterium]
MEYLFNQILRIADAWIRFFRGSVAVPGVSVEADWQALSIIGWVLIAVLFLGILYILHKLSLLRYEERKKYWQAEMATLETFDHTEHDIKWQKVANLLGMLGESDWRLAIMEADNILDTLLKKMGYDGDTVGEKLKKVEPSDFLTLPQAWEAHRVRNRIAHEGVNFRLSHREAQRIIELYKKVFEEFH